VGYESCGEMLVKVRVYRRSFRVWVSGSTVENRLKQAPTDQGLRIELTRIAILGFRMNLGKFW
jgi:hypothetical protein